MKTQEYDVIGMHCVSCSVAISKLVKRNKGVSDVEIKLADSKLIVSFDESSVTDKDIVDSVARLGYRAVVTK
ncbi:MAG: heavy-metal-associated domain-containing protein [Acholeplasmataceae bacterium]|jgi:Cu+-exporting ATPase|nr:heavy-metal-associated domain-containing protein [Acholeplasmataceae bacterium]